MWNKKTAFDGLNRYLGAITNVLYGLQQSTLPGAVGVFRRARDQFHDRLKALCVASCDTSEDGEAASKSEFDRIKKLVSDRLSKRASRQRQAVLDKKKGKCDAIITVCSVYCVSVMSYRLFAVLLIESAHTVAATREASADTSVVRGETCTSVASITVVPSAHFLNTVTEGASSLPIGSDDTTMEPTSVPSAGS
jgi:hypothetical protein